MSEYYSILTNYGTNQLILAAANKTQIKLSQMGVGDGQNALSAEWSALPSENYRANINNIEAVDNITLKVECDIPASAGGWAVRQIGVYDENGKLFACARVPETLKPLISEGSSKDLVLRVYITVSDAANITLKVDDNVVLATRSWTQSLLDELNDELTNAYKAADTALETKITNAYKAADTALETKITNAYKNADTALETKITNAYKNADAAIKAALQKSLNSEINTRASQYNELSQKIANISSSSSSGSSGWIWSGTTGAKADCNNNNG